MTVDLEHGSVMAHDDWEPGSFEDRLLSAYLRQHAGTLFLEVRVGGSDDPTRARRIDAVLVPGSEERVVTPEAYSSQDVARAVRGRPVHLIEAKRTLNRNVIGQVLVGRDLFEREFESGEIRFVALCAAGEPDLEWVCGRKGVEVAIHPVGTERAAEEADGASPAAVSRDDVRKEPDRARRSAFLAGWTDAVNGQLYSTMSARKTHANMGNLFGWIYGDQDHDFRLETWDRYVESLNSIPGGESRLGEG